MVFALALLALSPIPSTADQVVTNGGDSGAGSLRNVVAVAAPGETITFAPGVTTVTLTGGEIVIAKNLTIQGSGIGGVVVQRDDAAPNFRIFQISGGASVTLRGLTVRNGRGGSSPHVELHLGGGGVNSANSSLTIEDCVVADNQAPGQSGGGITSFSNNASAILVVRRSIVRDNSAFQGGGIASSVNGGTASLTVIDSTLDGNASDGWASAILNDSSSAATATLVVSGSTISGQQGTGAAVVTFAGSGGHAFANATFTNSTVASNPSGGLLVYGQVQGTVSQTLHHVTVLDSTIETIAAPQATATTTYDRSVFAFTDDGVATYFVIGGAGSLDVTSNGYNVSKRDLPGAIATDLPDTDPLLDPAGLTDNGGETDTVALRSDSPARDLIPTADCAEETDQRGVARPQPTSGHCDSGAVEMQETQTISFTGPESGVVGGSALLTATGGPSGNPVVFSIDASSGAGVCHVSGEHGSTVNYTAAGSCVINANQAGNATYAAAAQVQQTVPVGAASQTITVTTSAPGSAVFGTSFPVAATASSGLSVTITTTGGCSIEGGTVTMTSGTTACAVQFNQAGNASYGPAPEVVQNVIAQKAGQAISFAALPARTLAQSPIEVSATASSGLAVSFTTTTSAKCTSGGTNGATITLVATGTCTVKSSQAGNADYHPAPAVTQSFTIGKADQTISITTAPPSSAVFGSTFPVAATASSTLPVAITTSGGCALVNGAVRMTSGTTACVVRFNQSGNATYKPAPQVVANVTAQKAAQTITVTTAPPASAVYRRAFSVAATASSGLAVSVTTSGGCSGSSGAVTMTSGTTACVIRFAQPGNGNYAAAPETVANVTAEKASQTINFAALPNRQRSQSPFTVSASATSSLAVTFTTTTPSVCSSSGTNGRTIALVAAGTCTVQADQAGNANYNAAPPVARSFTVQ